MADGYLEKRMEDYLAGKLKPVRKKKPVVKKKTDNNSTDNDNNP